MRTAKDLTKATLALSVLLSGCGGGGGSDPVGGGTPAAPAGEPPESTARVSIAWNSAPLNVDGSCTAGVQGYRVSLGLSPGLYSREDWVGGDQLICTNVDTTPCGGVQRCSYTVEGLSSASWYISVQTVDVFGNFSDYSDAVIATVYVE